MEVGACADPPICDTAAVLVNPGTGRYRVLKMPDPVNLFTGCFVWSPDARTLACESQGQTDPGLTGIYTIRTSDGHGLTRITSNPGGDDFPIDYSPDGTQIAFERLGSLFVVHPDGSGLAKIPLAINGGQYAAGDFSWSPNGTKLVFGLFGVPGSSGLQPGLATSNADGSHVQQMTVHRTRDEQPEKPDWGPHPLIP